MSDEHLRIQSSRRRRDPRARASSRRRSKAQVTEQLRQRGLIVLDVSEKSDPLKLESLFDRFQRINMRDLAVFSRQFATLIASGMPMLRSLYTLEDQTEDPKIKEAIAGLRQDVEAGSSVADAMERRPMVFDPLYRSMVRAGEGSGRLEAALEMVAFQLEKLDALRRQIRSAMMYPALVFGFAVIVMIIVVAFIVPIFAGIFEELAAETPGRERRAAVHDADHRRRLRRDDRLLVHRPPGPDRARPSPSSSGRRPRRAATSGTR